MSSSAGKVLLRPRGTYDASATYLVLDWVLYQGKPYVAKDTTTGNLPTDTTHWQILLDFPTQFDDVPTQDSTNLVNSGTVYTALAGKQNTLTFDNAPTSGSDNPVKSDGIYTALAGKQNTLTFDNAPTQNSDNPVKSGGVYTALAAKQDILTFDNSPTQNSNNPVKSGGVYSALAAKQNTLTFDNAPTANSDNPVKSGGIKTALDAKQNTLTFDNTPTSGSSNPVTSAGIKAALDNAGGHTIKDQSATYPNRKNLVFKGFFLEDDQTNDATIIKKDRFSGVTWANGSDADIAAMLTAHYNNEIDIHDYWSVGDQRTVTLSAMSATGVGESHAQQQVTFVLMNAGGKTLETAVNGHTECAFIVGQKNSLAERGYMNKSTTGGWDSSARRTWCNDVYKESIPSDFRSLFKQHKNLSGTKGGSSSGTQQTTDYFALPAEIEVFGSTTYSVAGEGSQFKYYETSANRIKTRGEGGSADGWWCRSASSSNTLYFCYARSNGTATATTAGSSNGLAPFGCI